MGTDISGWCSMGFRLPLELIGGRPPESLDSEAVREVFFKVTGKPFNSVSPPKMVRNGGFGPRRRASFDEFEFDSHLGGDEVAIRLKDLDLAESRFDLHLDGTSLLGYGEWTALGQRQSKSTVYLVMELVDGGTLRDLLDREGRLSPEDRTSTRGRRSRTRRKGMLFV